MAFRDRDFLNIVRQKIVFHSTTLGNKEENSKPNIGMISVLTVKTHSAS